MQNAQRDFLTRILREVMGNDVGEWTPVQNGMKLGVPNGFISVFNSGKIVVQGKDSRVKEFLEKAKARCEAATLEELYAKENTTDERTTIRYTIHYTIDDIIEKLTTVVEGGDQVQEHVREWARKQMEKLREGARDEAPPPKPLPDILNELKGRIEAVQKRVERLENSQSKKRFRRKTTQEVDERTD